MSFRRWIFPLGLAFGALLAFAAPSIAQHAKPQQNSKPQRIGVFMTPVISRNQQISRTRILYLPQPAASAIVTKPTKSGGGGGNGGSGGGGGHKGGGGGSTGCPTTAYNPGYTVGCVVAPTTSMPEAEEEIAADPGDPTGQTYVAAISDFSLRGGYNTTKWAITTTGGGSSSAWTQNFVPLGAQNDPETSDNMLWDANSDPVVAIDNSGNVYLSDLYLSANFLPNGLYVSAGTIANLSSGGNFGATNPVMVNTTSNQGTACDPNNNGDFCVEDKPWVAVDKNTGYVYVAWSHFTDCQNILGLEVYCNSGPDIYLAYSTDHGASWSQPITIDSGTIPTGQPQTGNVQGAQVAVGSDGTVYVAYEAFDPNSYTRWQYLTFCKPTASPTTGGTKLSFSFPTPVNLNNETSAALPYGGFFDLTFSAYYRVNSFPALAIGPAGQVYLEYASQPLSNAEIDFLGCPNTLGKPCSDPANFNGGNGPEAINATTSGQEFFPAISVDSNDVVHTSWFDTRNSPTNTSNFDVYATFNNGSGWAPLARVTPTTIQTGLTSFIGDYSGIASAFTGTLTLAHPVWNDFAETCGVATCKVSGTMQSSTLTVP